MSAISRAMAVSYTHLDVYKRQDVEWLVHTGEAASQPSRHGAEAGDAGTHHRFKPVRDVYKRQEDEAEALFNAKMDSVADVLEQQPTGKTVAFFYITRCV